MSKDEIQYTDIREGCSIANNLELLLSKYKEELNKDPVRPHYIVYFDIYLFLCLCTDGLLTSFE